MKYTLDLINMNLSDELFKSILQTIESQILYSEFIYQSFIKNFQYNHNNEYEFIYNSPIELYRDTCFINTDFVDTNLFNPVSISINKNFTKINI